MGPDGLIDLIKTWRTAFPDGRMEIDALIVEGDTVAIRNTWYGTQEAEFYGIPPSGKSVAVTSVGIDRVTGRPRHRGLGRARHGRDDAAAGRAAHRRPRRGRGRRRPDLGTDRRRARRRRRLAGREPHDPAAASSRRWRTPTPTRPAQLVDAARSSTTAPAGARASFASVLESQAALRRGDARPELRARHDEHGLRGRRGRRRTRSSAARTPARRSSAPSPPATSSSGRTATSCGSTAARSSSAGRPPTC